MLFYNIITDLQDNVLFMSSDISRIDTKKEQLLSQNEKIRIYLKNDMFGLCELVFTNEWELEN